MKRINSLNDLLIEELGDLLDAENKLVKVLPKLAEASQTPALKTFLEDHLETTKEQITRLQDIFKNVEYGSQWVISKAMKRLIDESEDIINRTEKPIERDAAIISMAQRIEHYEIIGYQTAFEHAADLGENRIVELLKETLEEEMSMNLHLNELAQSMINVQAIDPKSGGQGFYIPDGRYARGGVKKKSKSMEVSRFISEGNPNIQEEGKA